MNAEPSRQAKKAKSHTATSTPAKRAAHPPTHTRRPALPGEEPHLLIAKRAYELYSERGYRHGCALEDWLEAEREIVSQLPPP